jgi:hypothetical protein
MHRLRNTTATIVIAAACSACSGTPSSPTLPAQSQIAAPDLSAHAPRVSIKEIPIPSIGDLFGAISQAPNGDVYISSYTPLTGLPIYIGARYSQGTFTPLSIWDPTFSGEPTGAVGSTWNGYGDIATQLSATVNQGYPYYQRIPAVSAFAPSAGTYAGGFFPTSFAGQVTDMHGDAQGNLWVATSQVGVVTIGLHASIARVSQATLTGSGTCCAGVIEPSAQLGQDSGLNVEALAVDLQTGDAWIATSTSIDGKSSTPAITRVGADLSLKESYSLPNDPSVGGMAIGRDGAIWFTDTTNNEIGRMSKRGKFKLFPLTTKGSGVDRITSGGDGALWFTETNANKIGRITTRGKITEYAVPTPNSQPAGIAGPFGANCNPRIVWFVEANGYKLGQITLPS